MLAPTLRRDDIVLLDNLSSHKIAGIEQAITAQGAQLVYLPPYSPDLNPIEQAFAKFKAVLRKAAECTREDLWQTIGRTGAELRRRGRAEASAKLKSKSGYRVPPSTLAAWIAEHRDLTAYARLREEGRVLFKPSQAIRTTKLYHRQVYDYAYHQPKLAFLRASPEHERFAGVADFLEAVPARCPHDLFKESARASESAPAFLDRSRLAARRKENFATRLAQLVIPSVGDNYRRHETLQRFMLANDSVTLAVEVPIWLTPGDISALERQHGIKLRASGHPAVQTITGHIDFLQVRNGAVHILDYKPGARTDRPFAQLTIYALALTRLVAGLRLFDIKCAWFDEEQYCEFFPRTLLARQRS